MFDLFAMLLSSVASFLFPIFASYKALKTSDPAQLTPWLMYWSFSASVCWLSRGYPLSSSGSQFYGYLRLLFFLYLILPQTQGARVLYEEHVHPFLADNETSIDEFIASAHERLKAAGMTYFRRAVEYLKTNILNLPPSEPEPTPPSHHPLGRRATRSRCLLGLVSRRQDGPAPPTPATSSTIVGERSFRCCFQRRRACW
ncbi:hypothetical protein J3459_008079 [Metarhizium acridum]|nr:hypothetical protein J3459_008079 [Metarhizium acridum]